MPLSSAFSPDKIPNIKDVTWTPEKKIEKIFDPERDIKLKYWDFVKGSLRTARITNDWRGFTDLASKCTNVFFEELKELSMTPRDFDLMIRNLNELRRPALQDLYSEFISQILLIFPGQRSKLQLGDAEKNNAILEINKVGGALTNKPSLWKYAKLVSIFLILFPDSRGEIGNLDESIIFENLKEDVVNSKLKGDWREFGQKALLLISLYPERKSEIQLSSQEYGIVIGEINDEKSLIFPNANVKPNLMLAQTLQLLSAEEVRRGKNGCLIISDKPKATELKEETPPLPVTRNY